MMDSLPPNDPHRNSNNNNTPSVSKGDPNSTRDPNAPIEVFGDMQDSPMVVAMFLVGVVTWFLRERCIC